MSIHDAYEAHERRTMQPNLSERIEALLTELNDVRRRELARAQPVGQRELALARTKIEEAQHWIRAYEERVA